VLLSGFSEMVTDRQLDVLAMPAQSISIANILNGVSDGDRFSYNENIDLVVSFTAPEARILIVDDISTNLEVASGLLKPYKMKIDLCESGFEAIEKVQSSYYDLVFMDHMMPGLD
jgi:PleD family two-component response regulator